jgi:hypothetical protein
MRGMRGFSVDTTGRPSDKLLVTAFGSRIMKTLPTAILDLACWRICLLSALVCKIMAKHCPEVEETSPKNNILS